MSDIDTAVVDSLKALDPEWPIREARTWRSLAALEMGHEPVSSRSRSTLEIFHVGVEVTSGEHNELLRLERPLVGSEQLGVGKLPAPRATPEISPARASALAVEVEGGKADPARRKLRLATYHSISGLGDLGRSA